MKSSAEQEGASQTAETGRKAAAATSTADRELPPPIGAMSPLETTPSRVGSETPLRLPATGETKSLEAPPLLLPKPSDLTSDEVSRIINGSLTPPSASPRAWFSDSQSTYRDEDRNPGSLFLPRAREFTRNLLSTTYEDPRTGARAGYENGFFAEIPLPGGGLGYNHRQGLHAGWAAVTDESMLSLYGDPRYLHALAANKEMAAYARMPTQSLLRGDPQLDRFNFRSDSLAVDWHPGQLDLNFQHGALSAEVHNNHYIFGLQEGGAGALFSDRAAGAFYADDSLKFSGFLDPTDPRYGRTDLWVEDLGRLTLANSPEQGFFVRSDVAYGNTSASILHSRDSSFAALTYIDREYNLASSSVFTRDVNGERLQLMLDSKPVGFLVDYQKRQNQEYLGGGVRLSTDLFDGNASLFGSGGFQNGNGSGFLGAEYNRQLLNIRVGAEYTRDSVLRNGQPADDCSLQGRVFFRY